MNYNEVAVSQKDRSTLGEGGRTERTQPRAESKKEEEIERNYSLESPQFISVRVV